MDQPLDHLSLKTKLLERRLLGLTMSEFLSVSFTLVERAHMGTSVFSTIVRRSGLVPLCSRTHLEIPQFLFDLVPFRGPVEVR